MKPWLLSCFFVGLVAAAPHGDRASAHSTKPSARLVELREVASLARRDPPAVQAARARVERARAARDVARAAYVPTVTGQADYGPIRQQQLFLVPNAPNQKAETTGTRFTADGRFEWMVTDFGGRRAQLSRAEREVDAARHLETQARFDSVRAACESYVEVLTTQRLRDNAELSVTRRDAISSAIARLIDAGLRPRVDLQRAEIEAIAARAELSVLSARAAAQTARLAAAMGIDPALPLRVAELEPSPFESSASERDAVAAAERQRPELSAQRAVIDASRAATDLARTRLLPSLYAFAAANVQQDSVYAGSDVDEVAFVARAGVAVRLRALDLAAVRSVQAERAGLEVELSVLSEQALRTRADAVAAQRELTRAREALLQAEQMLAAARTTREAQHLRYQAGEASLLELLDAEAVEQEARSRRILTLRELELSRIALLDAMGALEERVAR